MGEHGNDLPNNQRKRSSENSEVLNPTEVVIKRPRFEMSNTEMSMRTDRRQKNKEAAEKSRRKKREEFSKILIENDQLQRDKCQLVAMIESMKCDLRKVTKETNVLIYKIDHLKRWIGKHARELGLGKHMQNPGKTEEEIARSLDSRNIDSVLQGDPSLHSIRLVEDEEQDQLSGPESPALPSASTSSLPSASATPTLSSMASSEASILADPNQLFLPVGICTIELPASLALDEDNHGHTGDQNEAVHVSGQRLTYLSKDNILMVHDDGDRQLVMVIPKVQEEIRIDVNPCVQQTSVETSQVQHKSAEAQEIQHKTTEAPKIQKIGMEVSKRQKENRETPEVQQAGVATVQEISTQDPRASHTTVFPREMQTGSVHKRNTQQDLYGGTTEKSVVVKSTLETTKNESMLLNANAVNQVSLANTIDTLLKMGCKIQLPGGLQLLSDPQETPAGNDD